MASERDDRVELLQGTLELIVLRALSTSREAKYYSITQAGSQTAPR